MNILDKIQKVSAQECESLRRLPYSLLIAHCATVFDKVGIPHVNPIPEEYFDAVIDGIIDEIYDGIEPEFETEAEYGRYENAIAQLKRCEYIVEEYEDRKDYCNHTYKCLVTSKSPYQDKTIPFLGLRKK